MKRIILWLMAALLCLGLFGCTKSVEQQVAEQLELGQKYLLEQKYEEAMVAFNKAIELEPRAWEAYAGVSAVYMEQGLRQEASQILEQGITAVGLEEIPAGEIDALIEIYLLLAEEEAARGNREAVMEYYERILKLRPEDSEVQSRIERRQQIDGYQDELKAMALAIVAEDTYDFGDTAILNGEFRALAAGLTAPVIFEAGDGNYIGVYPGGYLYYGPMEDGIRTGEACWYYGNLTQITIVRGTWENDMPNGMTVVEKYTNLAEFEVEEGNSYSIYSRESGRVENGIYEGVWEDANDMTGDSCDHQWSIQYVGGRMQAIGTGYGGVSLAADCQKCPNGGLQVSDMIKSIAGVGAEQ